MNYFLSKSILNVYSLTTLSVGIFLSLSAGVKVSAQESPLSNLTDSVTNSTVQLNSTPSSSELAPELEKISGNTTVNVIEFDNSDLTTPATEINFEEKPDPSLSSADVKGEFSVAPTQEINRENPTANLPQQTTTLVANNLVSNQVNLAQNNPISDQISSACVKPLELGYDMTQLGGQVNLQELLADLEEVFPRANPLFFPTQPQEVSTNNIKGITLAQAIELGEENNKDLQVARLNLERSQYVLEEALAGRYPTLGVEASFNRNDSSSRELSLNASGFDDGDTISTSLTSGINLNYNLYNGGRTNAQISIAQEQIKFNQLDYERIKEQIRLDITRDYYRLQSSDSEVFIQQQAVEDAGRSLRDAELLEQAGLGTKFDVLRAQVDLADAKQRLISAIAQQRVARRQLTQRLSLGEKVEVFASDQILVSKQWSCSLEDSIIKAYRNRSELEQFLVQRTIEEQQVIVENSSIKPEINFFANYDILGVLDDDLAPADGFQLGVNLQWTLFDGGRANARVNQNRLDQNIAETQFADQRNKIRFEVEEAYYNLDANLQNIQTAAEAVELAKESLRLARLRFGAGVGTQTDVINSQTELTRARGNFLRAIVDYNLSVATLERAVSNLPDERLFLK